MHDVEVERADVRGDAIIVFRPFANHSTYLVDTAGFKALHATAVRQRNARTGRRFEASKIRPKRFARFFEHGRVHDIDAQAARQFDRGSSHETLNGTVDRRRACAVFDGFVAHDSAGQCERAAVVQILLRDQHEVDLAHEFVVEANAELLGGHLRKFAEMNVPGGGHNGIDLTDRFEQRMDAVDLRQVDAVRTSRGADLDDVVTQLEFGEDGAADCAGCTNDGNFHERLIEKETGSHCAFYMPLEQAFWPAFLTSTSTSTLNFNGSRATRPARAGRSMPPAGKSARRR